jgi:hypothetical protein
MSDQRLLRHLSVAIVLKFAALAVLWWVFVRDAGVTVDSAAAAQHVAAATAGPARSGGPP